MDGSESELPVTRLAVFGSPIDHSQSPALHAAAYAALGLDWEYGREKVEEIELADKIASLGEDWRGISLTMPLKRRAYELADAVDAVGQLTGSVNTLLFGNRRDSDVGSQADTGSIPNLLRGPRLTWGFNTDVAGIVAALATEGIDTAPTVEIVGGGATATSALVAASVLGATNVSVAVRSPNRAGTLRDVAARTGIALEIGTLERRPRLAPDLVIVTVPGGTAIPDSYDVSARRGAALLDVAYDPWPSEFAVKWQSDGAPVLNGLVMLVHQALAQVRIFLAGDPSVPVPHENQVFEAMCGAVGLGATNIPRTFSVPES